MLYPHFLILGRTGSLLFHISCFLFFSSSHIFIPLIYLDLCFLSHWLTLCLSLSSPLISLLLHFFLSQRKELQKILRNSAFVDLLLQRAGKSPSKRLSNELMSFRASTLAVMCYPSVFCMSHTWCVQRKKKMGRPLKADRAYSQVDSLGNLLGKRLF